MAGHKLIGLGLILLFGLPALIAASDRRRTPDLFHFALGIAALVWAVATGGLHAALLSLAAGAAILSILVAAVAFTQRQFGRRILTGGELKLMTAAAMWLSPLFAVATIAIALIAIVGWLLKARLASKPVSRPDLAPFVITTLLAAFTLV